MQESIKVVILIIVASVHSRPIGWMEAPEEYALQDYENYVISPNEIRRYEYVTTTELSISRTERIDTTPISVTDKTLRDLAGTKFDNQTLRTIGKLMRQGLSLRNALHEVVKATATTTAPEATSIYIEEIFPTQPTTTETLITTLPNPKQDKILKFTKNKVISIGRPSRQQAANGMDDESAENEDMMGNVTPSDEREPRQQESSEESDEDEGGGLGGVGGLISSFLSSLSKPDGGVDVDAIAGLIGSLSTQNDDGSFDFSGLTELLMSFFGADEEGGGGSDIGRFLGGLTGAFIKGVAQPPGPKGAGIFTGKVLGGVLPALSAPAATDGASTDQPQLKDAGGYVTGLLGSLSAGSNGGNAGAAGSKFPFIKTVIGIFTSILTSASSTSSSSGKSW